VIDLRSSLVVLSNFRKNITDRVLVCIKLRYLNREVEKQQSRHGAASVCSGSSVTFAARSTNGRYGVECLSRQRSSTGKTRDLGGIRRSGTNDCYRHRKANRVSYHPPKEKTFMTCLRPELIAERPSEKFVSDLKTLTEEIIHKIDHNQDCTVLLEKIVGMTCLPHLDEEYFRSLHSHTSVEEFVGMASLPRAKQVDDLSREELEDIVKRAMNVLSWDAAYYSELFDRNVPMQGASNLIYYPPEQYSGNISDYDPSPEEIVELATAEANVNKL
jgi:hypothetical protein